MNIFIDESGIHKAIDYSTIVLVYIDLINQENTDKQVRSIEKNLKIDFFHWADHGWSIRKKFLKQILQLQFSIKVVILQNPIDLRHQFPVVLEHLVVEKNIRSIYIDGRKPRWYQNQFKVILRKKGIYFKKLKMINDESCPSLRIADACAGFIRSYIDNPSDIKRKLYKKFSQKITLRLEGQFAS